MNKRLINTLSTITTITIIFYVLLLGCQSAPVEGNRSLSNEEVIALFSDKTIYATSSKGKPYIMYFQNDGEVRSAVDRGTWEVRDGSLCNTWNTRGPVGCDKIYQTADGRFFYILPNGQQGRFDQIVAGNIENL